MWKPLQDSSIDVGDVVLPATVTRQDPKTKSRHRYEGSIPVAIFDWLPEIRAQLYPQLERDSYIGINTVFTYRKWPTSGDMRRVSSVWVDCDFGHALDGMDYLEGFQRVSTLQADGVVPPFSVVANTGGGLHVYWLLKGGEDDPHLPPRGYPRNVETQVRLNQELVRRVAAACPELEPDPDAVWATSHQRIHGSVNSSAGGAEVHFTVNYDRHDEPLRYTLDDLCEFFSVDRRPFHYQKRGKSEDNHPAKLKGWQARWENTLNEFQLLRSYVDAEGGFPGAGRRSGLLKTSKSKGTRRWACMFLATILRGNGYQRGTIEAEVLKLASSCNPPLPRDEAMSSFRSAMKPRGRFPKEVTIAQRLQVTTDLADLVGLTRIRPDREAKPIPRTGKEKPAREVRIAFLTDLADDNGVLHYDYDQLVDLLEDAGLPTPRGTVYNHVKRAGLRTRTTRRRRAAPDLPLVN